ncbi:MMPL family transporter [Kineosporia babensis]|uniref:MMPL family transporter n=1 Tax=Kineosporia babensis TaxID=499548 RepID=A0A9X1NJ95_9ACTN|nr:MMPL family transporter [Kineosporia babensis]MCD5315188.1 MMPL family transporter [Kineosporia babensis]
MAWHLFRLGSWSFRHRRLVAGFWIALLAVVGFAAAGSSGQTNGNFTLSGMESTDAFELIKERSPETSPDGATARLVIEGEALTSEAHQALIGQALEIAKSPGVQGIADPFSSGTITEDGTVAYATISYRELAADLGEPDKIALEDAKALLEAGGLEAHIGGDALSEEMHATTAEVVGIAVALVVLVITFGSLVAAGMPLITALIGVGIGALGITALTSVIELSSVTPALGTMLGLAVGIDYALFIMSRYQQEVRQGRPLAEAAGVAVGTAGSAVIFAGLTVIIALLGLSITGIGFLIQMGVAGAAMVALAVLIALTLLPAALGFAGHRVIRGRRDPVKREGPPAGQRWVQAVSRFKVGALVLGVALAAVISLPVAKMELALPDDATFPAGSDRRLAYDTISENFGPGANGPLLVVVDTAGSADQAGAVSAVQEKLSTLDVAALIPPVTSDTPQAQEAFQQQLDAVNLASFTVVPRTGPADADTKALVETIRDAVAGTDATVMVTGTTAVGVDISQELLDIFPLYLLVVVGLAFVLLVLVFRSILVPLKAALGFLLSVGVALGAVVAVFQWGWLNEVIGLDVTTPVLFILPLLLTGVLFGLAMDYEVFIVTRMREAHVHGTEARQAVIDGFAHSARVVTAAAIIMFGVFAGFALSDDIIIKTIGFGLAVGVLADAFLVRMLIVPAVMAIVGERIWWLPARLERALPNLDVEGEALVHRLNQPAEPVTV